MRLSNNTLHKIALALREHVTSQIEAKGQLNELDIRELAAKHTPYKVRSERSLRAIDAYLTEM